MLRPWLTSGLTRCFWPHSTTRLRLAALALMLAGGAPAHASTGTLTRAVVDGTSYDQHTPAIAISLFGIPMCSGVLLTPWVVATAAHCNIDIDHAVVYFGGDTAQGGLQVAIADRKIHPGFDPEGLTDDIALLRLAEPAPQEIPLWSIWRAEEVPLAPGDELQIFGDGTTSNLMDPWRRRAGTVVVEQISPSTSAPGPGPH